MKIVFTSVRDDEKDYYKNALKDFNVIEYAENIERIPVENIKDADILCIFVQDKLKKDILEKFEKLKLIVTRSAGIDHIDIEYCRERGITVCHIPAYSPKSIAELTFSLILSLARKLKRVDRREDTLNYTIESDILGVDLYTLTIGIIGTGRIGYEVAKIAKGFQMNIQAFDIKKNQDLIDMGVRYVDLDDLIKTSDVITLHVPYTKSTHHLINEDKIASMKDGVILINTSRGKIVDTDSLYNWFKKGKFGGIGLDVFEDEEILIIRKYKEGASSDKVMKILEMRGDDRVIITPHIAFYTEKATENIKKQTVECIKNYIYGKDISSFIAV